MVIVQASIAIILGIASSIMGDVYLKRSGFYDTRLLLLGILFYALGALPVAYAFNKMQFGIVFLIWEAFTVIVALIVASILFKEPLTTYKMVALLLAVGALCFSYL